MLPVKILEQKEQPVKEPQRRVEGSARNETPLKSLLGFLCRHWAHRFDLEVLVPKLILWQVGYVGVRVGQARHPGPLQR